ncbi:MAG: SDR family NAD(P)-dependent oxidoreductase [Halanaerobiales bacterium]
MEPNVYITGADRGLGFSLAKKFLQEGYTVYAGRFLEDWDWLSRLQKDYPARLSLITLDVGDLKSVENAAEEIAAKTSSLDILINNAGILYKNVEDIFGNLDYEAMRKMYEINTLGPLKVTSSVVELLVEGEEKILVNISSEAGSIGDCWRKKEYGYTMSKAAVNKQSAILQNHLREYGIKVFAIHPGYLRSYMFGEKNLDGDIEPADSAEGIYSLIKKNRDLDCHIYYDYRGRELPW